MKLTTAMMAVAVLVGSAAAQNTNVIDNTRNTLNQVQQKQTSASNAALAAAQGQPAPAAKPSAAVPAKNAPAPQNTATSTAKPTAPAVAKPATPAPATTVPAKGVAAPAAKPAVATAPSKAAVAASTPAKADAKKPAAKAEKATPVNVIVPKVPKEKPTMTAKAAAAAAAADAKPAKTEDAKSEEKEKEKPKEYSSLGKRDPFLSPVVAHTGGSGCSTGKKCLDIAQINLRGVVKSDSGMIAVVTNSLNKAYFLRENDPVFNGYVIKITGDSIVFKESYQDQLGKPMTRDVTKKITTPAV